MKIRFDTSKRVSIARTFKKELRGYNLINSMRLHNFDLIGSHWGDKR